MISLVEGVFMRIVLALLAGLASLAFAPGANAKDRPFSWTGFYVGGLATWGWADAKHCDNQTCIAGWPAFQVDGSAAGFTLGYNYQISKIVVGVELDWSWGKINGGSGNTPSFGCGGLCATSIESIGTLRGRLGYAFGNLLAYGTAGAAFTDYEATAGFGFTGDSTTKTSFVYGGGLEYAFAAHWSAKVEYLLIDKLGDFNYDRQNFCGGPPNNCFSRVGHIETVRAGLNYRF